MSQIPLWQPPSLWRPPDLNQLPSWANAKRVAIDLETDDPKLTTLGPGVRRGARIAGVAFKIEDGGEFYLPVGHSEDNLPKEQVFNYLRDQGKVFKGFVCGANLGYDLDFLAEVGCDFASARGYRDVQIAEPLIDELQESYSLEAIARRHGLPGKDTSALDDAASAYNVPRSRMCDLPGRYAGAYAIQDVRLPLLILRRQEKIISERGMDEIYQLESDLIPVLLAMRRRGVLIDQEELQRIEDWSYVEQRKALENIRLETGILLGVDDMDKKGALASVLQSIGVKLEKTQKSNQFKIDKNLLQSIEHPVGKMLVRAKKFAKLRGTFVSSIREHMCNGRIHTTFNQMRKSADDETEDEVGGRYGRLSSTDPNLQQQPGDKDPEIGKPWRKIYIPEPGNLWAAEDYAQQEPRWVVHFAEICKCTRAAEAAERYRTDPKADNHTMMAQLVARQGPDWVPPKPKRTAAKELFLGLCYGMGGAKLARKLNLPTEMWQAPDGKMIEVAGPEAKEIIDDFHSNVPFVRELSDRCQEAVRTKGYIKTVLGRQLHFPEVPEESRRNRYDTHMWLHKALNRLIQGSSADQTKKALLLIEQAGFKPQLQVHDEIDLSVPSPEVAEQVAEIMRTCIPMRIPMRVDVEIGTSWGDTM